MHIHPSRIMQIRICPALGKLTTNSDQNSCRGCGAVVMGCVRNSGWKLSKCILLNRLSTIRLAIESWPSTSWVSWAGKAWWSIKLLNIFIITDVAKTRTKCKNISTVLVVNALPWKHEVLPYVETRIVNEEKKEKLSFGNWPGLRNMKFTRMTWMAVFTEGKKGNFPSYWFFLRYLSYLPMWPLLMIDWTSPYRDPFLPGPNLFTWWPKPAGEIWGIRLPPKVLTAGGYQSTYGLQMGGTHPTGVLSCFLYLDEVWKKRVLLQQYQRSILFNI